MFSSKPNYVKLRTNLRLCINRLKLLEKKKTELALKARREIADYITAGKDDRARIRVEHIIREDYLVEAMEIVEMLCDLVLARFGLIEKMSELDPGIEEAVATLIWVAPRLSGDIQELREVAQQLMIKYGKEFSLMCQRNGFENVNEKVVHKMSLAAPPKLLVEHYMIEIARTYKVPFEPDPLVMTGEPEVSNLIDLGIDALSPMAGGTRPTAAKAADAGQIPRDRTSGNRNDTSFPSGPGSNHGRQGAHGDGSSGQFPGNYTTSTYTTDGIGAAGGVAGEYPIYSNIGFPASGFSDVNGTVNSFAGCGGPSVGGLPPGGKSSQGSTGTTLNTFGANETDYSSALIGGVPVLPSEGQFPPPIPPGYMPPSGNLPSQPPTACPSGGQAGLPTPTNGRGPLNPQMSWINDNDDYFPSLPPYDQVAGPQHQYPSPRTGDGTSSNAMGPGFAATLLDIPSLPDVSGLPSIPSNSVGASSSSDDVDFDDLTRRFEELKRRK